MSIKRTFLAAFIATLLPISPCLAQTAVSGPPAASVPNGYLTSKWYLPSGILAAAAGVASGNGSISCYPGYVNATQTTAFLGIRISTLFSTGNVQLAIYANSATNRPTGPALVSTASISTTTATFVPSAAVFQLQAWKIYWFCSNMDNAVSAGVSVATTSLGYDILVGDTGSNLLSAGGTATLGVSTPQTFGTWPDLTSATWTIITTAAVSIIEFNPGSIP